MSIGNFSLFDKRIATHIFRLLSDTILNDVFDRFFAFERQPDTKIVAFNKNRISMRTIQQTSLWNRRRKKNNNNNILTHIFHCSQSKWCRLFFIYLFRSFLFFILIGKNRLYRYLFLIFCCCFLKIPFWLNSIKHQMRAWRLETKQQQQERKKEWNTESM